jgi:hypothetical protein
MCRTCYARGRYRAGLVKPYVPGSRKHTKDRYYRKHKAVLAERVKRYSGTLTGRLVQTYANMQRRVWGITKPHLYAGLELLPRDRFYDWSLAESDYPRLFAEWDTAGRPLRLAPSIDRIDPTKGYVLGNMRWITHSDNSRGGAQSRWSQRQQAKGRVYDPTGAT